MGIVNHMSEIITLTDVSKEYDGQLIIDNVSFAIEAGSITTLVGPNGAGKTTIARLILDIETPSSGHITRDYDKHAYIPQKIAFNYNLPLNVSALVKYLGGDTNTGDVADVMDFAQLKLLSDQPISTLSGGQLQKVFLATAMLSKPKLIVLDEPTQGLDIRGQEELYTLLEHIRDEFNVAIFMISHDLYTVMKKSDKVLCLNHHICFSGTPDKRIKTGATLSQIGLYTHHHNHSH